MSILLPLSPLHPPLPLSPFETEVEITPFSLLRSIISEMAYFKYRFLKRYINQEASFSWIPNPDTNAFLPIKSGSLNFELSRIGRIIEAAEELV